MGMLSPENSSSPSKRCRFLCSVLKDAFSQCHPCKQRSLSYSSSPEEETPMSDFDDVQEEIVSIIRARAKEGKQGRKDSTGGKVEDEEKSEEYMSVESQFSVCVCSNCGAPVAAESEAFFSVKTDFSQGASVKDMKLDEGRKWWGWEEYLDRSDSEMRRRAIIQEFCHCQGWPFGLCRKLLLLPPLPKSPSDSWTWCKPTPKLLRGY